MSPLQSVTRRTHSISSLYVCVCVAKCVSLSVCGGVVSLAHEKPQPGRGESMCKRIMVGMWLQMRSKRHADVYKCCTTIACTRQSHTHQSLTCINLSHTSISHTHINLSHTSISHTHINLYTCCTTIYVLYGVKAHENTRPRM